MLASRPLRQRASRLPGVTLPDWDAAALSSAPTGTAAPAANPWLSDDATNTAELSRLVPRILKRLDRALLGCHSRKQQQ
jgi:hypothetical protein